MPRRIDLDAAAAAIDAFLVAIGAPQGNPELERTGQMVARAFAHELLAGYDEDPAAILADATASSAEGLVIVRDLDCVLMCPHHLLPAAGVVHVAYCPGSRVVGFGALGRLTQALSRRLVLQEDFVQSVTDALMQYLDARGAACLVDLAPTCMTIRGGCHYGARATSSAYSGTLRDDIALRQEFLVAIAQPKGPAGR